MLVFMLRSGERVYLGDDTVITILEIDRERVKVGFDAPLEVPVHREAVYRRIQAGQSKTPHQLADAIALSDRHIAVVDRVRTLLGDDGRAIPSRRRILETILDGVEEMADGLGEVRSLDELKSRLLGPK